jgi:DNA polymerase-3 subunit alpha
MFFPAVHANVGVLLAEDTVVAVKGRLDRREDVPRIVASELSLPDVTKAAAGPVAVRLPAVRCTPPLVERLREVLASHPGTTEVHLHLEATARTTVMRLGNGPRVTPSPALMGDLKALLGSSCLG